MPPGRSGREASGDPASIADMESCTGSRVEESLVASARDAAVAEAVVAVPIAAPVAGGTAIAGLGGRGRNARLRRRGGGGLRGRRGCRARRAGGRRRAR